MELSGLTVGLASEGSFGPDPFTGMFPWNVELLVWIDDHLGIEVVGMAQGAARSGHLQTGDWAEVEAYAVRQGFPQHQLVLRPEGADDLAGVNYLDRPATTILAGWKRGMISM